MAWAVATARSHEMSLERLESLQKNLVIDLSQCVTRGSYSTQIRAMTQGSHFLSFGLERCLDGAEHLRLLGIVPEGNVRQGFSERELKELAGQAFAAPCAGIIMMSLLLALR